MSASAQKMKLKCLKKRLKRKREHCDAGQLEAQSGKALSPTPPRRGDFVTWNRFPSSQPHTNRLTAHYG